MGRPALSCAERTAAKPGCHCDHCRAYWRERNQRRTAPKPTPASKLERDRAKKREWAARNREAMKAYMREFRRGLRRARGADTGFVARDRDIGSWRCDCGQLNQSTPCRCGFTPQWAQNGAAA